MNTFKEILTSENFRRKVIENNYCTQKSLDFILQSYHLQPLIHLITPITLHKYVLTIMQSKKNPTEILVAFNNYPICVEFNKYLAPKILREIRSNTPIAQALKLQMYTQITGYTPKKNLQLYTIYKIEYYDIAYEKSKGLFTNHAVDARLHQYFEEMRQIILLNRKHIKHIQEQSIPQSKLVPYSITDKTYPK